MDGDVGDGPRLLRIATRGSPLARTQSESVAERLRAAGGGGLGGVELVVVRTTGDLRPADPVALLGGQGAFVKEVQEAVLDGRADLAVHSAKDLPGVTQPGLVLACVPERADPRDALVGAALETLRPGATVATGSVRHQASWARLDRSAAAGAGVLALAGLARLGLDGEVAEVLEPAVMLPQVAQGALAVECREDDAGLRALLAGIDDDDAHRAVRAERAFLGALGGGCSLPLAALAVPEAPGGEELRMEALLASRDGRVLLRDAGRGRHPEALGLELAGRLLDGAGGRGLEEWRR